MVARADAAPAGPVPAPDPLASLAAILKASGQGQADAFSAMGAALAAQSLTISASQAQCRSAEERCSALASEVAGLRAQSLEHQKSAEEARLKEAALRAREARTLEMLRIVGLVAKELAPDLQAMVRKFAGISPQLPAHDGAAVEAASPVHKDDPESLGAMSVGDLGNLLVQRLSPATVLAIQNEAGADLLAALLLALRRQDKESSQAGA